MELPVDPKRYAAFLVAMTLVAIFPGPANLFSTATGMARGWRSALAGVAGMNTATLVWYAAAALGLGALIAGFPEVFRILRLAGAVYLVWLAWTAFRGGEAQDESVRAARPGRAFRDGFTVQVANPKLLLFFTAVLPPFIDVERPIVGQLAMLGAAMIVLDVTAMSAYALGGAALSGGMRRPRFKRGFEIATGLIFLLAAGLVAISTLEGRR